VVSKSIAWATDPEAPQVLTVGGSAGTGKSTILRHILNRLLQIPGNPLRPQVVSLTGRAVSVLRSKGIKRAQTIHSLIYEVQKDSITKRPKFTRRLSIPHNLLIVDEASVVTKQIHEDLKRLAKRILYVGDHLQLEPVGDDPELMRTPYLVLTTIHRQVEGSPIISLAHDIANGRNRFPYDPLPPYQEITEEACSLCINPEIYHDVNTPPDLSPTARPGTIRTLKGDVPCPRCNGTTKITAIGTIHPNPADPNYSEQIRRSLSPSNPLRPPVLIRPAFEVYFIVIDPSNEVTIVGKNTTRHAINTNARS